MSRQHISNETPYQVGIPYLEQVSPLGPHMDRLVDVAATAVSESGREEVIATMYSSSVAVRTEDGTLEHLAHFADFDGHGQRLTVGEYVVGQANGQRESTIAINENPEGFLPRINTDKLTAAKATRMVRNLKRII